jgi:hypothetical protein
MPITVEATYENGTLKLSEPLPLKEHEKVHVTIDAVSGGLPSAGIVPCANPQLIEWAALDPELEFPPSPEER